MIVDFLWQILRLAIAWLHKQQVLMPSSPVLLFRQAVVVTTP